MLYRMQFRPFILSFIFFALVGGLMLSDILSAHDSAKKDPVKIHDYDSIIASDTLHVVMGYNSVNYFVYKGTPMGYQYEMVQELCKDMGLFLDLTVTNDVEEAFRCVAFGKCDLLAMDLTVSENRFPDITFTNSLYGSKSFLVQKKDSTGKIPVTNLRQLKGKTIVIPRKTIYLKQLQRIKDSLNIDFNIIEKKDLGTEDLANMMANGDFDFTVCDEHLARTLSAYRSELDFSLVIAEKRPLAWAVNSRSVEWENVVNQWLDNYSKKGKLHFLQSKYFDHPVFYIYQSPDDHSLTHGKLSKYDRIIQKYSRAIDWDWRLVASVIYQESRFTENFQSPSGAFGIMQMMPATAAKFGVHYSSNVEEQIKGGIELIHYMDTAFAPFIADKNERQQVVIGAYNLGMPHFYDAFELAKKHNMTPITYQVVLECLKLKRKPKYYNDPVVKYGYINPWYMERFVHEIYARYNAYCAVFPEK